MTWLWPVLSRSQGKPQPSIHPKSLQIGEPMPDTLQRSSFVTGHPPCAESYLQQQHTQTEKFAPRVAPYQMEPPVVKEE